MSVINSDKNIIRKKLPLSQRLLTRKFRFLRAGYIFTPLFWNLRRDSDITPPLKISTISTLTPLTGKLVELSIVEYFYKIAKPLHNTHRSFSINFRDYNRKPYWKLRKARLVHWDLETSNTINKRRYTNYLATSFSKDQNTLFSSSFLHMASVNLPHTQFQKINKSLTKHFWISNISPRYSIFKLPIFLTNYLNWNLYNKKEALIGKKLGKWAYLNFKRFVSPWLDKKKKKIPYFLNSRSVKYDFFKKYSYFDSNVSVGLLFKETGDEKNPLSRIVNNNFLLKLNVFRYQP